MKNLRALKNNLTFILFLFSSFTCAKVFAQSSRQVSVNDFSSIGVSSGINLHLKQGNTESLVIKGDEEVIKDVVVEKNDRSISIKYKEGVNWSRLFKGRSIDVYVTFKNLNALAASGGSDVYIDGQLKTDKFSLAASGGSDVKLNLVCKDIKIAVSGGADIELKGSAENMSISASGGSDISAFDFRVDYAQVNSSGGADVDIYVNKGLTAAASGGSDITYKGNASLKKTSNSKSGDIIHAN
ncbi:head GIN domain-containing protein [Pedobacter nanyangensis]|uniref:head GIN domain-containing protein n=1 Tax=Pedobacter nanyangensis TaxID=1562389 RepID=UPI000DE395FE|nr:head GIN domain-containing protein [Pedobacter nanyangensis]